MSTLSTLTASVNSFMIRFPEFADTDPILIQLALDEALLFMGNWTQPGQIPAQLYLTAHILALNSYAADNDGLDIQSESIGRISLHYRVVNTGIIPELQSTVYGRRFRQFKELGIRKFETLRSPHRPWGGWTS